MKGNHRPSPESRLRPGAFLLAFSLGLVVSGSVSRAEDKEKNPGSAYQAPPKIMREGGEPAPLEAPPRKPFAEWAVPAEGELGPFLESRELERHELFEGGRFPNVVVTADGTVIGTWGRERYRTRRSLDGGTTWEDEVVVVDPGFHGGGALVDEITGDVLVFSNVESDEGRERGTLWASFDGGETWPIKRLVEAGAFAYSSLAAGRPGTPSEGWIYLLYEHGGKGVLARLGLTWLLEGEPTGDGDLPEWITGDPAR